MFGSYLSEGEHVNGGIGPSLMVNKETSGAYLKPTRVFEHEVELTIA